MNNFIIIVLICISLFYITQKKPAYGFLALVSITLLFVYSTINKVTKEDVKYRNQMISDPKSRFNYYQDINHDS